MSATDDELDMLAAEYVLGTLDPREASVLRRRAESEPAVRAAISAWETRLSPLAGIAGDAEPPAALWGRIAGSAGLGARPGPVRRAWRSVAVWRGATAVGFALAAAFAAVAWVGGVPRQPVAALVPQGSAAAAFVAEVQPDGRIRLVALQPVPVEAGKNLELWALPRGAKTPIALGVLPQAGRTVPPVRIPSEGTQLMISLEPTGGSPTGMPTGPVLFAGTLGG